MKTSRTVLRISLTLLSLLLGSGNSMANYFGKSELSGIWKERFQDVNKLNEYAQKGLKTEISDVLIKDYDLVGAEFVNATFRDVEWNNTSIEGMTINNGRFIGNTFNEAFFNDAKLTNVTFEDSEFNGVYFSSAQMNGVKFIHCKFTAFSEAIFRALKDSNVEFEYTTFESEQKGPPKITFAGSTANLTFRNSTVTDIRLIDMKLPSTLTFEKSKLQDVDMDRSNLNKLVMDGVTGGGATGFRGGSVLEVEVNNSDVGFGLNEGTINKVSFVNSTIDTAFISSKVKEFSAINCRSVQDFNLYKANIDNLQISNCPINRLVTIKATIHTFNITDSSIANSEFKKMNVKHFTLTNVTLDQTLDFTGAQVEIFLPKNVTKASGAQLKMDGSNIKF